MDSNISSRCRPDLIRGQLIIFSAWFKRHGGYIHPATELVHSFDQGLHLRRIPVTSEGLTLPRGTRIISCPHSLTISAYGICGLTDKVFRGWYEDHATVPALDADLLASAPRPQSLAAVSLCYQLDRGAKGDYEPYLNLLPRVRSGLIDVNLPLWWSKEETSWVAGSPLTKGLEVLEDMWKQDWHSWGMGVATWAASKGWCLDW